MSLINTSKDVLNIVLALSVIGISFFLCWGLFYLVMILRSLFKTIKDAKSLINKLDETLDLLKERIEHSVSYLSLMGDGIKKIVSLAQEFNKDNKKKKGKK